MLLNPNDLDPMLAGSLTANLTQKTLMFTYPKLQKSLEDILLLKKLLLSMPCFSGETTRMKPIECDRSIEALRKVTTSAKKMITLIRALDADTSLVVSSRNYGVLMSIYHAVENISKLIELTRMLRGMGLTNDSERAKVYLKTHDEFSAFLKECEKIEKGVGFLLDSLLLVVSQNEGSQSMLVT